MAKYTRAPLMVQLAIAPKQDTAISADSHTAAAGENSATAAACAMVSCFAISPSGRA